MIFLNQIKETKEKKKVTLSHLIRLAQTSRKPMDIQVSWAYFSSEEKSPLNRSSHFSSQISGCFNKKKKKSIFVRVSFIFDFKNYIFLIHFTWTLNIWRPNTCNCKASEISHVIPEGKYTDPITLVLQQRAMKRKVNKSIRAQKGKL